MKANELRIGNYVLNVMSQPIIADLSTIKFANDFEPIILTEEWLEKFGFKKRDNDRVLWFIESFTLSESEFKSLYFGVSKIEYVHELQNLYFALTETELSPN